MTIMAFACDNNNDLFIEQDGNLAVVFNFECAVQSIKQMLSLWLGEYVFNNSAGMPYGAILGISPEISQAAAEKNIIKILEQNTAQVGKFCVNWNQYLLSSVNGNKIFSDEDYEQYQTTVKSINYIQNNMGHNIMVVQFLFGNSATSTIEININEVVSSKYRKYAHRQNIKIEPYVSYQETVLCTIQTPPNFIIDAGNIVVVYKQGGMYSNFQDILGNIYYENRILKLQLEAKTEPNDRMFDNYEVICPDEMNVKVLTV